MDCFAIQSPQKNSVKKECKKIRKHLCGLYVIGILVLVVVIVQMILQIVNYDNFSSLQFWKKKRSPESEKITDSEQQNYLQKDLQPIEEEEEKQSEVSNEVADDEHAFQ